MSSSITLAELAKTFDHVVLQPFATDDDAWAACRIALKYQVASVCVKPCHVKLAQALCEGSNVAVCTVIGFPHGGHTTATKVFEAKAAIEDGATELDMVINIGKLVGGDVACVQDEIASVVQAAQGLIVKVIFENAYLTQAQKVAGYKAAEAAGADFIKTSTGFAQTGATVEDLRLMRASVGPNIKIKASGGIRTLADALAALEAGASRIGTSSTEAILKSVNIE